MNPVPADDSYEMPIIFGFLEQERDLENSSAANLGNRLRVNLPASHLVVSLFFYYIII